MLIKTNAIIKKTPITAVILKPTLKIDAAINIFKLNEFLFSIKQTKVVPKTKSYRNIGFPIVIHCIKTGGEIMRIISHFDNFFI